MCSANVRIFSASPCKETDFFHFTKKVNFIRERWRTVFSLLSPTCSFNGAKYSFVLAFIILFSSQVHRDLHLSVKELFGRCVSVFVGSSWAVLEPLGDSSALQLPSLAQLLSWPLERFCHTCWFVVFLFVCLFVFKVCQSCQLVFFPLFSCYIWRTKVGWKARNFLLLFCPSPVTLITFCFLLAYLLSELGRVWCIVSGEAPVQGAGWSLPKHIWILLLSCSQQESKDAVNQ